MEHWCFFFLFFYFLKNCGIPKPNCLRFWLNFGSQHTFYPKLCSQDSSSKPKIRSLYPNLTWALHAYQKISLSTPHGLQKKIQAGNWL